MSRFTTAPAHPKYVIYLAVLPFYREACIQLLLDGSNGDIQFYAGSRHIDASVTTGIDQAHYSLVTNKILASRLLVQFGSWAQAVRADTTLLDLNPRNLTAWLLLLARRSLNRRTLVWGHLHPRSGPSSSTAALRRMMRRLANGTVLYGYDSVVPARIELPNSPVWVAPNSLYRAPDIVPEVDSVSIPDWITYVGRLEPAKKVDVLIRAFARSNLARTCELVIVGDGSERAQLEALASTLGVAERVHFHGTVSSPRTLRSMYARSACAVSPGYVGLSLTQSLGFGVPMIVSRDEPHAPELELKRFGGVTFFATDDEMALADALVDAVGRSTTSGRRQLSQLISQSYSAEAMASGLTMALFGEQQQLMEDGWPRETR